MERIVGAVNLISVLLFKWTVELSISYSILICVNVRAYLAYAATEKGFLLETSLVWRGAKRWVSWMCLRRYSMGMSRTRDGCGTKDSDSFHIA